MCLTNKSYRCLLQFRVYLIFMAVVMMSVGCGMSVKRTVYESMQNIKEQQCLDDPARNSPECVEREPYDVYERKRQSNTQ